MGLERKKDMGLAYAAEARLLGGPRRDLKKKKPRGLLDC